ncbi:hypothetical protein DFH09DRAFT_1089230 [Mycena vulgaris]|nr:hypothetical protein DFH09DRAFT_1089230 [Mycena vulgaris]
MQVSTHARGIQMMFAGVRGPTVAEFYSDFVSIQGSTSEQCSCSAISYVVWACCDACDDFDTTCDSSYFTFHASADPNFSWDDYADEFSCRGLPQQYPPPFPSGKEEFASWVFAMVSATPVYAAHNFQLGGSLGPRLISNTSGSASYHRTGHLEYSDPSYYGSSHYDSSHYDSSTNALERFNIPSNNCTIRIASETYSNGISQCKWITEYSNSDVVTIDYGEHR